MSTPRDFEEEITRLRNRMNQILGEPVSRAGQPELMDAVEWLPPLDVMENKDDITVRIDVPGVDPGEIDLSISGDILYMTGERKQEVERGDENYHTIERGYGKFARRVKLPTSVDVDSVKASYKNGVLTVKLPKLEEQKTGKIKVN